MELESSEYIKEAAKNIVTLIGNLTWPSNEEINQWNNIFEGMKKQGSFERSFSDITYSILKDLLDEYFKTKNPTPLFEIESNIYSICMLLDNSKLYNPPLTAEENKDKLKMLLNDIAKEPYLEKMILPLLKVNLRQKHGIPLLQVLITKIFKVHTPTEELTKSIGNILNLYIDRKSIINEIQNMNQLTLEDALKEVGIEDIFLYKQYKFFSELFFDWIIAQKNYSGKFLGKNTDRIKECSIDEQKVISAFIIHSLISTNTEQNRNNVSIYLKNMDIKIADIKSYWTLNNAELQAKYSKFLYTVYLELRTFITSDFVRLVFDYLYQSHDEEMDKERLLFWLRYARQIENFKVFINKYEKDQFKGFLKQKKNGAFFINCLSQYTIYDTTRNYSPAPDNIAILFKLGTLIIAEFPKSGHPLQVFQLSNIRAKDLLYNKKSASMDDVHFYKDNEMSRYSTARNEGSIAHRGDWMIRFETILKDYDIHQDMNVIL